jgi:hypothetical protein
MERPKPVTLAEIGFLGQISPELCEGVDIISSCGNHYIISLTPKKFKY